MHSQPFLSQVFFTSEFIDMEVLNGTLQLPGAFEKATPLGFPASLRSVRRATQRSPKTAGTCQTVLHRWWTTSVFLMWGPSLIKTAKRTASAHLVWRASSTSDAKRQNPRAKDHLQLISLRPCDVSFLVAARIHSFIESASQLSCSSSLCTDSGWHKFPGIDCFGYLRAINGNSNTRKLTGGNCGATGALPFQVRKLMPTPTRVPRSELHLVQPQPR